MQARKYAIHAKVVGDIEIQFSGDTATIATDRLTFKSFNQFKTSLLAKQCYGLYGNPENVKMYCEGVPWSRSRVREYIKRHTATWYQGNKYAPFAVYENQTGAYIGNMGVYYPVDTYDDVGRGHRNVAEIGYIIDRKYWGNGYGTEFAVVAKKYISFLARQGEQNGILPVPTEVTASSHPGNGASKRILQKVLKNREDVIFKKHNGNPRLMFFKPIKKAHYQDAIKQNFSHAANKK